MAAVLAPSKGEKCCRPTQAEESKGKDEEDSSEASSSSEKSGRRTSTSYKGNKNRLCSKTCGIDNIKKLINN